MVLFSDFVAAGKEPDEVIIMDMVQKLIVRRRKCKVIYVTNVSIPCYHAEEEIEIAEGVRIKPLQTYKSGGSESAGELCGAVVVDGKSDLEFPKEITNSTLPAEILGGSQSAIPIHTTDVEWSKEIANGPLQAKTSESSQSVIPGDTTDVELSRELADSPLPAEILDSRQICIPRHTNDVELSKELSNSTSPAEALESSQSGIARHTTDEIANSPLPAQLFKKKKQKRKQELKNKSELSTENWNGSLVAEIVESSIASPVYSTGNQSTPANPQVPNVQKNRIVKTTLKRRKCVLAYIADSANINFFMDSSQETFTYKLHKSRKSSKSDKLGKSHKSPKSCKRQREMPISDSPISADKIKSPSKPKEKRKSVSTKTAAATSNGRCIGPIY